MSPAIAALIKQAAAITEVDDMIKWIDALTMTQARAIDKYLANNGLTEDALFPNLK